MMIVRDREQKVDDTTIKQSKATRIAMNGVEWIRFTIKHGNFNDLNLLFHESSSGTSKEFRKRLFILIASEVSPSVDPRRYLNLIDVLFPRLELEENLEDSSLGDDLRRFDQLVQRLHPTAMLENTTGATKKETAVDCSFDTVISSESYFSNQPVVNLALAIISLSLLMERCGQIFYSLTFIDYCISSIPEQYFMSDLSLLDEEVTTEREHGQELRNYAALQELFLYLSNYCHLLTRDCVETSTSFIKWVRWTKQEKIAYHLKVLLEQISLKQKSPRLLGDLLHKDFFQMFDSQLTFSSFLPKRTLLQALIDASAANIELFLDKRSEQDSQNEELLGIVSENEEGETAELVLNAIRSICSFNLIEFKAILSLLDEHYCLIQNTDDDEEEEQGDFPSKSSYSEEFHFQLFLWALLHCDDLISCLHVVPQALSRAFENKRDEFPGREKYINYLRELDSICCVASTVQKYHDVPPLQTLALSWVRKVQIQVAPDAIFPLRESQMREYSMRQDLFFGTKQLSDSLIPPLRLEGFILSTSLSLDRPTQSPESQVTSNGIQMYCLEELLILQMSDRVLNDFRAMTVSTAIPSNFEEERAFSYLSSSSARGKILSYLDDVLCIVSAAHGYKDLKRNFVVYSMLEVIYQCFTNAEWKEFISHCLFESSPFGSKGGIAAPNHLFDDVVSSIQNAASGFLTSYLTVFIVSHLFPRDEELFLNFVSISQFANTAAYYVEVLKIAVLPMSKAEHLENPEQNLFPVPNLINLRRLIQQEVNAILFLTLMGESNLPVQHYLSLQDPLCMKDLFHQPELIAHQLFEKFLRPLIQILPNGSADEAKELFRVICSSQLISSSDLALTAFMNKKTEVSVTSESIDNLTRFPGSGFFEVFVDFYQIMSLHDYLVRDLRPLQSQASSALRLNPEYADVLKLPVMELKYFKVLFHAAVELREINLCSSFLPHFFREYTTLLLTASHPRTKSLLDDVVHDILILRELLHSNYNFLQEYHYLCAEILQYLSEEHLLWSFGPVGEYELHVSSSNQEEIGKQVEDRITSYLEAASVPERSVAEIFENVLNSASINLNEHELLLKFKFLLSLNPNGSLKSKLYNIFLKQLALLQQQIKSEQFEARLLVDGAHYQLEAILNESFINKLVKSGFSISGAKKAVFETRNVATFEAALQYAINHNQDEGFDNPIVLGAAKEEGLLLSSYSIKRTENALARSKRRRMLSILQNIDRLFFQDQRTSSDSSVIPTTAIISTSLTAGENKYPHNLANAEQGSGMNLKETEQDSSFGMNSAIKVTEPREERDIGSDVSICSEDAYQLLIEANGEHEDDTIGKELQAPSVLFNSKEGLKSSPEDPDQLEAVSGQHISHAPLTTSIDIKTALAPKLLQIHQKLALSLEINLFVDHFFSVQQIEGEESPLLSTFSMEKFFVIARKMGLAAEEEIHFEYLTKDVLPFLIQQLSSPFYSPGANSLSLLYKLLVDAEEIAAVFRSFSLDSSTVPVLNDFFKGFLFSAEIPSTESSYADAIVLLAFLHRWIFLVKSNDGQLLHLFSTNFHHLFFSLYPLKYVEFLYLYYQIIDDRDSKALEWMKRQFLDLLESEDLCSLFAVSVFPSLVSLLASDQLTSDTASFAFNVEEILPRWASSVQEECQILKRCNKVEEFRGQVNCKKFIQSDTLIPHHYFTWSKPHSNQSTAGEWAKVDSSLKAILKRSSMRRKFNAIVEIFRCIPDNETVFSFIPAIFRFFGKYLSVANIADLYFLALLKRILHFCDDSELFPNVFEAVLVEKVSESQLRLTCYLILGWPIERLAADDAYGIPNIITANIADAQADMDIDSSTNEALFLPDYAFFQSKMCHLKFSVRKQLLTTLRNSFVKSQPTLQKGKIKKLSGSASEQLHTTPLHMSLTIAIDEVLSPYCELLATIEDVSATSQHLLSRFVQSFEDFVSDHWKYSDIFLWPYDYKDFIVITRWINRNEEAIEAELVYSSIFWRWYQWLRKFGRYFSKDLQLYHATSLASLASSQVNGDLASFASSILPLNEGNQFEIEERMENCLHAFNRLMLTLVRSYTLLSCNLSESESAEEFRDYSKPNHILSLLESASDQLWIQSRSLCKTSRSSFQNRFFCPSHALTDLRRILPIPFDDAIIVSELAFQLHYHLQCFIVCIAELGNLPNDSMLQFRQRIEHLRAFYALQNIFHYTDGELFALIDFVELSISDATADVTDLYTASFVLKWRECELDPVPEVITISQLILRLLSEYLSHTCFHGKSRKLYEWILFCLRYFVITPASSSNSSARKFYDSVEYYLNSLSVQMSRYFYQCEQQGLAAGMTTPSFTSLDLDKSLRLFMKLLCVNQQWEILLTCAAIDIPNLAKLITDDSGSSLYQSLTQEMTLSPIRNEDQFLNKIRVLLLLFQDDIGNSEILFEQMCSLQTFSHGKQATQNEASGRWNRILFLLLLRKILPAMVSSLLTSTLDHSDEKIVRIFQLLFFPLPSGRTTNFCESFQQPMRRDSFQHFLDQAFEEWRNVRFLQNEVRSLLPDALDVVCLLLRQGYMFEASYVYWNKQQFPNQLFALSTALAFIKQQLQERTKELQSMRVDELENRKVLLALRLNFFGDALEFLKNL